MKARPREPRFLRKVRDIVKTGGRANGMTNFGDAWRMGDIEMPTLVLDGGEVLIESTAILDYLDEVVGPEKGMIQTAGRRAVTR